MEGCQCHRNGEDGGLVEGMIGGGGGGGGREEATDSGDGVYGDKGNSESYYLLHGRNSDDVHLIGTQTPDQPECGA